MKLYTKSYDPDWGRIVDMVVEKTDGISDYIKDETVFKVIIHEKGEILLKNGSESVKVKEPSMIILSDKDITDYNVKSKGSNVVLYFMPSVIRDEFSLEDLYGDVYEEAYGKTIYQDYFLVRNFFKITKLEDKIFPLSLNELNKVKGLTDSIDKELKEQYDGFWPCRSRSYLMELLFYIRYICFEKENNNKALSEEEMIYSDITDYLNEHLSDNITLETITKEFNINRNKLNAIFVEKTSKTCLNFLIDLRIDMAKIMLSNTEIPIGEVSERVGYADSNYFSKIFKKQAGLTPSEYRKNGNSCK